MLGAIIRYKGYSIIDDQIYGYSLYDNKENWLQSANDINKLKQTADSLTDSKTKSMNKPYSIDWHGRSNTYYIYFQNIPSENVRTALKKFGLRWEPREKAWTIKDSYSNEEGYLLSHLENLLNPFYLVKNYNQDRIRIAKVKAAAKLKLLALIEVSEPKKSTKVQVEDMPVNSIYTDEKRFQNRANAFSSESANRIIKAVENGSFDWSKFDPIIIWFDDKAGKYFVLSGHSRLAAFKELSKTKNEFKAIPVKIFTGSQMQAIDLALNSNTLSTKETETERAMYYNRKRQTCEISKSVGLLGALTECEKIVENECRDNEGKNANYILNLSYLNPDGFLMDSLNKLGVEKDNDSTNVLRTIANWIGEARRNNKELLNIHETEIAKFLLNGGYGNKAGQFKNKTQFNERLKYSFDKWKTAGADPNKPLNLANTLSKSSFEQDFDNRLAKSKADLDQAINEHQEKHTKYLFARMNGQITEKRFNELMSPLIQNVDWHKKEYERIRGQKDDVKKAATAQTSLWGTGDFLRKYLLSKNTLKGWKDDKEKFKTELVNDIKDFLFTKWEKPWTPSLVFDSNGNPINSYRNVNGRFYRNQGNIIGLKANSGKSPYFITLSKVNELGGKILDKDKLTLIVSFVPRYKPGKIAQPDGTITPDWMQPLYHSVINVDYVEGIKKPAYTVTKFKELELNQYVENFLSELKKLKRIPELIYDQADKCFYISNPPLYTTDEIHLVQIHAFKGISEYYSTLFHEITHSTKSAHRLGHRDKKTEKKLDYANEELVAEMGAMIVCTELGLQYSRQNSLTYLHGWLQQAKKKDQNIDDVLIEAYSYACDAAEYLLNDIDLNKLIPETMMQRAEGETATIEKEYNTLFETDGIKVINHLIDERVKIFFNSKPDNSIIEKLKDSGFKWAHTAKAWQIVNTPENIELALKILKPEKKQDNGTRLRIAKAKAAAKLKLLVLTEI
jgi:antirestriction protein ArdC